jgi:glycine oxidase
MPTKVIKNRVVAQAFQNSNQYLSFAGNKHMGAAVLIIGGGLSGCHMSMIFHQRGYDVTLVDQPRPPFQSSRVAAGLFNPILIGRIKNTWMADTLFPFAFDIYPALEKTTDTRFFHPTPLIHLIESTEEMNDWDVFLHQHPQVQQHRMSLPIWPEYIRQKECLTIPHAGRLDIPLFMMATHRFMARNHTFISQKIDFRGDLLYGTDGYQFKGKHYEKVVWCLGAHEAYADPGTPFSAIPLSPLKGDIITIQTPAQLRPDIFHEHVFMMPLDSHTARVGSTYDKDHVFEGPDPLAAQKLMDSLRSFFLPPFTLIQHEWGVRPTVSGRKPLMGEHPDYPGCYVLNGMGSKGVTLAPYFAHLLFQIMTSSEVAYPKETHLKHLPKVIMALQQTSKE